MTNPKVGFVTQYFPPEVYPQTLWVAQALARQGLEIAVTTSVPNYPSGKTHSGYRASRLRLERVAGLRTMRVPVYPSHDHHAVGRIANYSTFALSAAWYARATLATADVSLVWATPATVGFPALASRIAGGTPYVLYVQDLWPDSVFATDFLTRPVFRASVERGMTTYLNALYGHASHVVAITPGMASTLVARGVDEDRISVVYNWVDESVMRPEPPNGLLRGHLGCDDEAFVMVFAGNQGVGQGLDAWLAAMDRLRPLPGYHLVLVGSGSYQDALRRRVAELELDSVHFRPQVPIDEVSDAVADADVSVLSLTDSPLFHITMPSKTQAALAQGKAIISSAPGETSATVRRAEAGWTAMPDDPDSIAKAIVTAREAGRDDRQARGAKGRAFYMQHMSRAVGAGRLSEILREAASEGKPRPWRR